MFQKKQRVTWSLALCTALILAIVVVITARAQLSSAAEGSEEGVKMTAPSVVTAEPQQNTSEEVESEVITIHPTGFEPSEITRPRGEFLLVINNRSGLEDVSLRLTRNEGARLREVRVRDGKLRSGQFENLPPGRYELTEANHPDWVCRITITAR